MNPQELLVELCDELRKHSSKRIPTPLFLDAIKDESGMHPSLLYSGLEEDSQGLRLDVLGLWFTNDHIEMRAAASYVTAQYLQAVNYPIWYSALRIFDNVHPTVKDFLGMVMSTSANYVAMHFERPELVEGFNDEYIAKLGREPTPQGLDDTGTVGRMLKMNNIPVGDALDLDIWVDRIGEFAQLKGWETIKSFANMYIKETESFYNIRLGNVGEYKK